MKKITILALNLGVGGIEKYISVLANMFVKDYEVEIISTYKVFSKPSFYIDKKVKITYLIDDYPYTVSLKKLLKAFKIFSVIKELIRRKKLNKLTISKNIESIKNIQTDILITTRAFHNELVSKYFNKGKTVLIATDHNYPQAEEYFDTLVNSLTKFDYLVVATKELVELYDGKVGKTKVILIPNPISNVNNIKNGLNSKKIISVGRFSPEKGYLDLIEVMSKINGLDQDMKLTLIGDGEDMDKIKAKINEYHLNEVITLPGFKTQEEINKEYLKSSLFVMTSFTEAFGLVLIEAMNYGLPCIAFDSASGARELLASDIGVLIKNRDVSEMAKRIVKLINDKKELTKYQNKIVKNIQNYYPDNNYKMWKKLLNNDKMN